MRQGKGKVEDSPHKKKTDSPREDGRTLGPDARLSLKALSMSAPPDWEPCSLGRNGEGNADTFLKRNHGYGYKTLYAHMSKILVKRGQLVTRGEVIGLVGNTGRSVGPHLHYEVLKDGKKVDPANYFFNDLSPEEYEQLLTQAREGANQSFD